MSTVVSPVSQYTGKRSLDWHCVARVSHPHRVAGVRRVGVRTDQDLAPACGEDATAVLEVWSALSPQQRAFCALHATTALLAARSFLGITDARLEPLYKPCQACRDAEPGVECGFEYQAHACPHHHWNRQPLDGFGRCGDDSCGCMHDQERGSGPGGGGLDIGAYGSW